MLEGRRHEVPLQGARVEVEFLPAPTLKALSQRLRDKQAPPVHVVHPLPSVGAALMACNGIAAALLARETTGRGRAVETSLMAGALLGSLPVAVFYSFFVEYYVSGMTGAVKE